MTDLIPSRRDYSGGDAPFPFELCEDDPVRRRAAGFQPLRGIADHAEPGGINGDRTDGERIVRHELIQRIPFAQIAVPQQDHDPGLRVREQQIVHAVALEVADRADVPAVPVLRAHVHRRVVQPEPDLAQGIQFHLERIAGGDQECREILDIRIGIWMDRIQLGFVGRGVCAG